MHFPDALKDEFKHNHECMWLWNMHGQRKHRTTCPQCFSFLAKPELSQLSSSLTYTLLLVFGDRRKRKTLCWRGIYFKFVIWNEWHKIKSCAHMTAAGSYCKHHFLAKFMAKYRPATHHFHRIQVTAATVSQVLPCSKDHKNALIKIVASQIAAL